MAEKYIGLMSGTSLDGLDAVLVSLDHKTPQLLDHYSLPIPPDVRRNILTLCQPGENEIAQLAIVEQQMAQLSAQAVNALLAHTGEPASAICAIGSHGQTVRHLPELGYTLQVGDPNSIAEQTGITVVADFRRRDMAAGGQGAPLVPAFHNTVFASPKTPRAIVNIGGISNISLLPVDDRQPVTGFDTGPGNLLLDYWCQKHKGTPFDRGGQWAATATFSQTLLSVMMSDPFFRQAPPKSTGREQFNPQWLSQQLQSFADTPPAVVQATLCQLTAQGIARALKHYAPTTKEVYICGGGARNHTLMAHLASELDGIPVATTQTLGIEPEWVEAIAFAWLAKQTLQGLAGNLPDVTGAKGFRVLGGVYSS